MTSIEKITAIGKLLHMYEIATDALTDPMAVRDGYRDVRASAVEPLAHGICLEMVAILLDRKQEEF